MYFTLTQSSKFDNFLFNRITVLIHLLFGIVIKQYGLSY